jgi:RNA polymerase sigma-70 factor (ECF subfamily)
MSADRMHLAEQRDSTDSAALRQQLTELFNAFREPIYRQCLRILASPADAEDVAQEVFVRFYREMRARRLVENPKAWLFRAAHNLAIDRLRVLRHDRPYDRVESEAVADNSQEAEQALLARERHTRVLRSLEELSPQERRCMELRTEGLRYREIAEVLGVRVSTVETNLSRAVKKLMEKLHV